MYEDDRASVTLSETHQKLGPGERTIKQAATLPPTESTFTAGNISGNNDQTPRLVAPARDLPVQLWATCVCRFAMRESHF